MLAQETQKHEFATDTTVFNNIVKRAWPSLVSFHTCSQNYFHMCMFLLITMKTFWRSKRLNIIDWHHFVSVIVDIIDMFTKQKIQFRATHPSTFYVPQCFVEGNIPHENIPVEHSELKGHSCDNDSGSGVGVGDCV